MKRRALAVVLTLMMIVSVLPMAAFAAKFTDTDGHWAEQAIDRWTDEGVLNGMGDGTFAPNKTLSRAEAAAIFTRLLKLTEAADVSNFTDVEAGSWYEQYVAYAVAAGIMNGTSATTFDPLGTITRQDFFLILARAVGINEQSTCNYTGFDDLNQLSDYARGSVYALINLDYVHGRSATTLAPKSPITRASAAMVLDNVIGLYVTKDGTYNVADPNKVNLVVGDAKSVAFTGTNGAFSFWSDDAKADFKGMSGTTDLYVNADNVKLDNVKPGSNLTTGDNASGTNVNNASYNPDTETKIPDSTPASGGGGGGGGGGGDTPTYTLGVQLQAAGLRDNATATLLEADVDQTASVQSAMKALVTGEANYNRATAAIGNILDKFTGDYDNDEYYVSIEKNTDGGYDLIVVDLSLVGSSQNPKEAIDARVDLAPFVTEQQSLFDKKVDRLVGIGGITSDDLAAVRAAFSPTRLFEQTSSADTVSVQGDEIKMLTFLTPADYYALLQEMVGALADLQAKMLENGATADDFTKLFDGNLGLFKLTLDDKMTATLTASTNPLANLGESNVLMSENVQKGANVTETAKNALAVIDDVFSRDFLKANDPIALAIMEAAAHKGVIDGEYTMTLTRVTNS